MAKIKQHPTDPTMFMYWDIATDSANAFWTAPAGTHNAQWTWNKDYDKPTVTPSILNSCQCVVLDNGTRISPYVNHIFIRDGQIEYLSDCTHALAGKTVDMVDFPDDW